MVVINHDANFSTNVFAILQHMNQQQKQVFGLTLWSIWKHRNNKVMNNITQSICEWEDSLLTSWMSAQTMHIHAPRQSNT